MWIEQDKDIEINVSCDIFNKRKEKVAKEFWKLFQN